MTEMFSSILIIVSPIFIAAIGCLICERAGVRNIALEGLMSIGALAAAVTHILLETRIGFSIPLALIFAALSGGLFSLIHAFASVTIKANQLISGTGINLFSAGITVFICQVVFRMDRTSNFIEGMSPWFFGIYPTFWIAIVIIAASLFMFYRYPKAFTASPFIAVLISGFFAGLAGACVVLTQDTQFTINTISGKGFIALAAVYIGRKLPLGVLGVSFLFGISISFAANVFNMKSLDNLSSDILNMLPYLFSLLALVIFSSKSQLFLPRTKRITTGYRSKG